MYTKIEKGILFMEQKFFCYGLDEFENISGLIEYVTLNKSVEEFNGHKLLRFDIEPGPYSPEQGLIKVNTENAFAATEYPYMAISYRTKSSVLQCDMSILYTDSDGDHESWTESSRPDIISDTNIRSIVYDVRRTDAVSFPKGEYENFIYMIKPFGGNFKMIGKPFFFSIEYIAFFATKEEAEEFNKAHAVEPIETDNISGKTYRVSDYGKSYYGNEPMTVFTGYDIKYNLCLSPRTHALEARLLENGAMRFEGAEGMALRDPASVVISSSGANFSFLKYPVVKIAARSSTDELWVQVRHDKTFAKYVRLEGSPCDCGYTVYTFDIKKLCADAPINSQYRNITLALRACECEEYKITRSHTLELYFVGFFDNESAAALYRHSEISLKDYLAKHPMAYRSEGVNVNYFELDDFSIADRYIAQAEARKRKIIESKNTYTESPYGKTYYVSSLNGNDENDGLSPEGAWRTLEHVNSGEVLCEYDYVLFERGSLFRDRIWLRAGVTYSAYGKGDKPKFYGSIDASGEDSWIPAERENLWLYKDTIDGSLDIGNITCNGGEAWGVKVLVNLEKMRKWQGYCYNGFEGFYVNDAPFDINTSKLRNLEYWHDWETGRLYMYFDRGNPGKYFREIELSKKMSLVGGMSKGCVVDNLCFKYTGVHGIGLGLAEDFTVQYCEFGYIGGSIQSPSPGSTGRLGNAVECFGCANGYTIHDCYSYQIYDCCYTTQWQGSKNDDVTMNNVRIYSNVAELSNTGMETWLASHALYSGNKYYFRNMELFNNYNMYMGYGWSHQRVNKNANFFYGDFLDSDTEYINCEIHDNVNVYTSCVANFARYTGKKGFNFHDNVYVLERDKYIAWTAATPTDGTGRYTSYEFNADNLRLLTAHTLDKGSVFYSVPENCRINDVAEMLYKNEEAPGYFSGSRAIPN